MWERYNLKVSVEIGRKIDIISIQKILQKRGDKVSTPTVFISYSHDGEDFEKWVLKLATNLRDHGVNAILDQWDLRLGTDLSFFMENGLTSSNLILCICSESYVQKVNYGTNGAGYEGMILRQSLLRDAKLEYIIPIVRNNPSANKVPLALGSKNYIDFSDDSQYFANYQILLARIHGEDIKKKPPLGENPFSSSISTQIEIKTKIESVLYHSPEMDGVVTFQYDNNNGIYTVGSGEYAFDTRWSRSGTNSIHAYGLIGFRSDISNFPQIDELLSFNFSSRVRTTHTGQIVIFENMSHHFVAIKMGAVKSSNHGSPKDEMTFEYHIYAPL